MTTKHTPNKDGTSREKAEYWLMKAAEYDNGKEDSQRKVEMAFKAALKHENEAIAAGQ
jgi:hypothetical protein